MKKFISLLSACLLVFCAYGCGMKVVLVPDDGKASASAQQSAAQTESPTQTDETPTITPSQTVAAQTPQASQQTAPQAPANGTELSAELYDFQMSLNGNLITVPCKTSDLTALGFEFVNGRASDILEDNYTTSATLENSSGNLLFLGIHNDSGSEKTFAECDVDSITFKVDKLEGLSAVFAKGITFGATKADIIAAYGRPTDIYDNENYSSLDYEVSDMAFSDKATFTLWEDALIGVDLTAYGD